MNQRIILILIFTILVSFFLRTHTQPVFALINNSALSKGMASWYSKESPGIKKTTANNEIFDDSDMTCAMWGVPFHQMVRVTNLINGKSVVLRVNDRGPHFRFVQEGRIIDLTKQAFSKLSPTHNGIIPVVVEML